MSTDTLFERAGRRGDFVFDAAVAAVFPDMLHRSVPGYPAIINMLTVLAGQHAQAGSTLYDLGCSLGAAAQALDAGLTVDGCRIVAIDTAPAMIDQARAGLALRHAQLDLRCADIRDEVIDNASMVVLNFALQFVPPDQRLAVLRRVREGLLPGGVLVLSEKVRGADAVQERLWVTLHHAFKRANGYSDLEIDRKRRALQHVLLPETLATHHARLIQAGFRRVDPWFQCFNFVSLIAAV